MDGVPVEMTQEDILKQLQQSYNVGTVEEIRLIKNKVVGSVRQLAFVQFFGISDARSFLERHYPTINLYTDPKAEGVQVRIAFSREKIDRPLPGKTDGDWKCNCCYNMNYHHRLLCFRCNAPRTRPTGIPGAPQQTNLSSYSGFSMTGDSDVALDNTPSQFLLLRGLEPGVTEELVARGVSKLYKTSDSTIPQPTAADQRAPKKLKASSAKKEASSGAKEGSLKRVLLVRDRKTDESWRYAFAEFGTVEDAQAAMAKYNASEKFTISSKPVMISYVHAGVFVPCLEQLDGDFSRFAISPLHNASIKLIYWDQAAYVKELITVDETSADVKPATEAANAVASAKDAESKVKKRKAEKDLSGNGKKVVAPHLQFWTNRHAEIHGLLPKDLTEVDEACRKEASKVVQEAAPSRSFADMKRKCCLLCSRQFKTDAEINRHERISGLHRTNLEDKAKVKTALAKLAKSLSKEREEKETPKENEEDSYRDRAKERRQAFNQPKQPAPQQHKAKEQIKAAEEEPRVPNISKGATLLGKMGWTAGEGLGAQGTGMTTAIQTNLYSQGVGLGAEGGKLGDALEEADRNTKGNYRDFIDKTRDKAKERYESMN